MSQEITKSPEILKKEALIKDLQSRLTKRKRTLKGLKTRLENTKNKVTDIQRSGTGQVMSKMAQMDKLRLEILELVQQMKKIKGLSREDKMALKSMEQEFSSEDMFGEDFKDYKEQIDEMGSEDFEHHFDENERAKMRDIFEMFAVKPNKEEQKDIRKIFIRLSQKFHPDKAPTKADEEEYHQMMQKINEAYQAGDIQTLLELEQLFLSENLDLSQVKSLTVDVLDQEIERLERDLQFINNQIDRNGQELKNLRASDLGKMLTDMKRAEKEGMGMNAALEQLDESIERLTGLKEVFAECIKLGNTKPLEEMMRAEQLNQPSPEEMIGMLNDLMNGDMDINDLADMFGHPDEEDEDDLFDPFGVQNLVERNAKFKEGTSVKIGKRVIDEENGINLSGLVGRIVGIFSGFDEHDVFYDIELDSISVNQLPAEFVERMVNSSEDFQNFEVSEKQLRKCQPRDTEKESKAAYHKNLHRYLWNYLDVPTKERLQSVLLQKPDLMDWENWKLFLEKKLRFPIPAKSRGKMEFKRGEKFKIIGLVGYNREVGLIADVYYRNRPGTYPIFDLLPDTKNKELKQIFEDYLTWAEETFDLAQY